MSAVVVSEMIVLEHSQIAILSASWSQALAWRIITNLHANNNENQCEFELDEGEHLITPVRCRYVR